MNIANVTSKTQVTCLMYKRCTLQPRAWSAAASKPMPPSLQHSVSLTHLHLHNLNRLQTPKP